VAGSLKTYSDHHGLKKLEKLIRYKFIIINKSEQRSLFHKKRPHKQEKSFVVFHFLHPMNKWLDAY